MKTETETEFFSNIDDDAVRDKVKAAAQITRALYIVRFENHDMCSSRLGHTQYLCIGPGLTYESLDEIEGKHLGDLPSERLYPVSCCYLLDKALELVNRREFSFCSAYYRDPVPVDKLHPGGYECRWERFVVLRGRKSEAEDRAYAYAKKHFGAGLLDRVDIYPRTYVREARSLVAVRRYTS